jgi:hypothetical protein
MITVHNADERDTAKSSPRGEGTQMGQEQSMDGNASSPNPAPNEIETTDQPISPSPSRWPGVLVVAASIMLILATSAVWVRVQLLDTDIWVETSSKLLNEPTVKEAVSVHLIDVVYEETDVVAGLQEGLPFELEGLAAPLAGALRDPLAGGAEQILSSDRFQDLWQGANRAGHETLVAVLRDEAGNGVSTSDGVVALELKPLVVEVAQTQGLSASLLEELPDDAGRVVIFESDELAAVQTTVAVLEFLAWVLLAMVVGLYAAALYLAAGRRIALTRNIGWSLITVGLLIVIGRAIALRRLLDAMFEDPGSRRLADATAAVATVLLEEMGWALVIYGLFFVAFTALLGDHHWALTARRAVAPILNSSAAAVVGATVLLLLFVVWLNPGQAFDRWITAFILSGLIVAAVTALSVSTRTEFPEGSIADPSRGPPL